MEGTSAVHLSNKNTEEESKSVNDDDAILLKMGYKKVIV